jgi:MFS family permease
MVAAAGTKKFRGIGAGTDGGIFAGAGTSRTDLARNASIQNRGSKSDNIMTFIGITTVVGIVIGAIAGKILSGDSDTAYKVILITGGVMGLGFGVWASLDIKWTDDKALERDSFENDWMCLACGEMFREPKRSR